jgi:hypothetical protein
MNFRESTYKQDDFTRKYTSFQLSRVTQDMMGLTNKLGVTSEIKRRQGLTFIELYPDSVFWFGIGWYFPGIFPTDTEGKLGRDILVLYI